MLDEKKRPSILSVIDQLNSLEYGSKEFESMMSVAFNPSIPYLDLKKGRRLGYGQFGEVYEG